VDSLIIGADTYHFDVAIDESHPRNNRPHIRLRIDYPPSGNIVLNAAANSSTVHFWNVLETTTGVGNTGWDFNDLLPGFVPGDNQYGIGEPAASKDAISVGAYLANLDLNGQKVTYDIAGFSSLGPTLDGRTKPDLCAPGVSVASSISSFTDRSYSPVESITFNGRTYDFAKFSGTSMASPVVAGIVALMLEANPYLTPSEIKEILQETCRYDDKTGDLSSGPNNTWGYGKVSAYSAVQRAAQLNGVFRSTLSDQVSIYPNPSERIVRVSSPELIQRLELWSIDGKKVFELNNSESEFSTQGLAPGVYHLWIYTESSVVIKQLIKS
jgi:subtilisin family serine protease